MSPGLMNTGGVTVPGTTRMPGGTGKGIGSGIGIGIACA